MKQAKVSLCNHIKERILLFPDLDLWQFRLSDTLGDISLGHLYLSLGDGLEVISILDACGDSVGKLIGFPIDLEAGRVLARGDTITSQLSADNLETFVEHLFERLAGRFLLLVDHGGHLRIYADGSAQVPCVYDPDLRIAAASAHAVWGGAEYDRRLNKSLFEQLNIQGEGWFPAGLTAHEGLFRLLPNHYLDLHSWQVQRHWPKADLVLCDDPHQVTRELTDIVRQQVYILLRSSKKVAQAMTAGRETRALLACAKPYAKDVTFVTVSGEQGYQTDTLIAQKIITDLGYEHRSLPVQMATEGGLSLYMHRGGHCVGDTNARTHPSVRPLYDEGYCFVGGSGGEVGRGFFWRPSDTSEMSITAKDLIARMGLPAAPLLTEKMEHWVRALPTRNAFFAMDLAYIEHRMGAWGGAQFCSDPTLVRFAPLVNRRAIRLLLSLPEDWKRSSRLFEDILQHNAPELLAYPFNSLGKWRDRAAKLQRALHNPHIIRKKIRKLFG